MSSSARTSDRRADLDALRVFAVYLLFAFHSAKVYDPYPWYHVWSPDLIPGIERFTGFVHLWHMPLLFLLAGWSLAASLQTR
ncbi:MAG: acyltransferase family protein, partial [Proteobacteria bacterium]|nr:acyltransferase family protein [Pseudomonadota bacterium]